MKKLMILAAAVMLASITHAAAVGWSIAGATAYAGGSYSVFVIGLNGVTDVNQMVALVAAGIRRGTGNRPADCSCMSDGGEHDRRRQYH